MAHDAESAGLIPTINGLLIIAKSLRIFESKVWGLKGSDASTHNPLSFGFIPGGTWISNERKRFASSYLQIDLSEKVDSFG